MRSFIRVKAVVAGLHHWPGAPSPTFFLRFPHRHRFIFEADVLVTHGDRDVEFFDFQARLAEAVIRAYPSRDTPHAVDFGAMSCEMIALWVLDTFGEVVRCTVSEDGENLGGAER